MRKVKVITDSCSDLSAELLKKYDIDYAQMRTVYEGKETPARLEWTKEDAHALYEIMRGGERVTTTQVPVEEFIEVFKKYLDEGYDIVYVGCCSKQSGSVNTAAMVASKLLEAYPDATIACIDSLNASMGEGVLAIEAAKLRDAGKSVKEIEAEINAIKKTVNEYVTVHSLTTLHKAGRVKGSAAFFGNLMGVKPIIISDKNGDQAAYKKVKGRQKSFEEIVALMKETVVAPETQTLYIVHSDCSEEEIEQLKEIVKKEIPFKDIYVALIGPIIGASIGPDAIGLIAFGKEVTFQVGEGK
ncbi:MAG: DegV family protein [Ruminococcaceae bacterium]|nr:DegV family protein [Oscillospiraceae bacterium]